MEKRLNSRHFNKKDHYWWALGNSYYLIVDSRSAPVDLCTYQPENMVWFIERPDHSERTAEILANMQKTLEEHVKVGKSYEEAFILLKASILERGI